MIVGDQSGVIHIWDLKTDHNEQLIPEPEVSINSVHIDPDASYMAAVNSSVSCLKESAAHVAQDNTFTLLYHVILMKNLSVHPPALFYRETVMCGTSLEASGMK